MHRTGHGKRELWHRLRNSCELSKKGYGIVPSATAAPSATTPGAAAAPPGVDALFVTTPAAAAPPVVADM